MFVGVNLPFKYPPLLTIPMASRSPVILPEPLQAAMNIRTRPGLVCPATVEATITKIPFLRIAAAALPPRALPLRIPVTSGENRFRDIATVRTSVPDGWKKHNDDGFDDWTSVSHKTRRGGGGGAGYRQPTTGSPPVKVESEIPRDAMPSTTAEPTIAAWKSSRYQPLETKIANESLEDRIMGKIRSKINKIGESTYEPTKAFMVQILDSGETDFLDEFMRFVFKKAATESSFCAIYARLLHELADEFGHLRTEMVRRFQEYTQIFTEAKSAPDVGTADYEAFVESQSQKKFRRGYSQFVAELAKLGEIQTDDFRMLVVKIVESIQESVKDPDNRVLSDELIDCLITICRSSGSLLTNDYLKAVDEIVKSPRTNMPGLSTKGLCGLMDLQDLAKKGK
jgi:MIF4G domain